MTAGNNARKNDSAGYDTVAAAYDARLAPYTARFARDLIDLLYPQATDRAIDIAGGTGAAGLHLAERIGPAGSVTIVDASAEMLKIAERNATARKLQNVEVRPMQADALEFPDAAFDVAVCNFGLALFSDVRKALSEAFRVLKPGGRIGVTAWSAPDRFPFYSETVLAFWQYLAPWPARAAIRLPLVGSRIRNRLLIARGPNGFSPSRFADKGRIEQCLSEAGFRSPRCELRAYPMEYENFDQLWEALEKATTSGLKFRDYPPSVVSEVKQQLRRKFVNPRTNEVLLFNEARLVLATKPS